jgi:hypothetical protein
MPTYRPVRQLDTMPPSTADSAWEAPRPAPGTRDDDTGGAMLHAAGARR